jgi:AcrR family transcriptional regulator
VNARFVPKTRDEQRALSRAMICASAKLLFQTRGYDIVSVEEIAKAAKVTRSTFYLHFKGKEDVLREVAQELLEELLGEYEKLTEIPVLERAVIRAWLEDFHQRSMSRGKDTQLLRAIARLKPEDRQAMLLTQRMRTLSILGRRFEGLRLSGGASPADHRKRVIAHLFVIQLEGVLAYFSATEGAPDVSVGLDVLAEQLVAMRPL